MSRALTEEEREMLVSTLELMRTGEHEALGPFIHTETEETWTIPPTSKDPTPYLDQVDDLLVEEEDGCDRDCTSCGRRKKETEDGLVFVEGRPCGSIFFLTHAERRELSEGWDNGGSGFPVAENMKREDDLDIVVFAKDGRLTEMETY